MRISRLAFKALQSVSPDKAAALAERLFFSVSQTHLPADCTAVLEEGTPFTVRVAGREIVAWSWGSGPVVYLVHGWGSRGGRLAGFVAPLLAAGYQVVTHDAPGHGASGFGMTSMPEFARALRAVDDAVGPAFGIVAHSMGASASTLAMAQGLTVSRAVFLAPAANPAAYVAPFAKMLGLKQEVVRRLRERSQRRVAFNWDDLDVPSMARGLEVPLLVFHDDHDRVVSPSDGMAITAAWPNASLVSTTGLGHRGVTSDPAVIRQAVQFLTGEEYPEASASSYSRAEELERELFNREARRV